VYGENGAAVTQVLVGGRVVVDQGRLLTLDEAALRRQAQSAAHAAAGPVRPQRL
jgi:guanine deaminase